MDPMKFALRLRLRKLDDTGLYALFLLKELLDRQGWSDLEVVQGYLTVAGETCWHCWIKRGDSIVDLGRILATLKEPEFAKCEFKYTLEKPAGDVRVDEPNVAIWERRGDHAFWKGAPKKFLEFRSKCHALVPKS